MTINDFREIWSEFFLETWLAYFPDGHTMENTNIPVSIQFKEEAHGPNRSKARG
ncbi:hypothetical protein AMTR_s00850p00009770, partial [Amborella trichopoda]